MFYFSNHKILAIVLSFLVIIVINALLCAVLLSSIKSGIGMFSGLLLSSLLPIKPRSLTKLEREAFSLPEELKQILVGLMLGDLNAQKQTINSNVRLRFEQGLVHEQYLMHLYELFKSYCLAAPKTANRLPDKRTGKVYARITFTTCTLPCFNEIYNLFYLEGKKIIPSNINELLTASSLAYWLADDGTFAKGKDVVILSTDSFSESDVDLLLAVLQNKFGLKCRKDKSINGFRIIIVKSSLGKFRELVQSHLPSSMLYKIGL